MFFENFTFFLRRAQAARGPYFLPLQKVGKDRRKGVSPPCGSPDQSGVLDAPLWKPPSLRWRGSPGRTPRRFAAGASVPLGKAASACALATAAAPPPLRVGGWRPLAPCVPRWKRLPIMRAAHGTASETAFAATPSQVSRKLLPRKRLGVPSLPSRGCGRRPL